MRLAWLAVPLVVLCAACPGGGIEQTSPAVTGIYRQTFVTDSDDCNPPRHPSGGYTTAVTVRPDGMNIPVPLIDGPLTGLMRFDLLASRGYAFSMVRGYSPDGSARVYDPGTEPSECFVQRAEWQLLSGTQTPIEVAWTEDYTVKPGCTVAADWLPRTSCRMAARIRYELVEECAPPATLALETNGGVATFQCRR